MTNLAEAQVIVLANHPLAQRKRARRFFGAMGLVLRMDDYRRARSDNSVRTAKVTRGIVRAPRSR